MPASRLWWPVLMGCSERVDTSSVPSPAEVILVVSGMSCQHCVNAVHDALVELPEVQEAQVDLDSGTVRVTGVGLDPAALAQAVEEAGYEAVAG